MKKSSKSKTSSKLPSLSLSSLESRLSDVGSRMTSLTRNSAARQATVIAGAMAVGATLAYFLDPDSGKKRRAAHFAPLKISGDTFEATTNQLNQLGGAVQEFISKGIASIKSYREKGSEISLDSDVSSSDGIYAAAETSVPAPKKEFNQQDSATWQ